MSNNDIEQKKNIDITQEYEGIQTRKSGDIVVDSLVSGSLSSAITTTIYQPLDLIKTRIQLQRTKSSSNGTQRILGRTFYSTFLIVKEHNVIYLWRGTGASLLRSVPGVGLYYASLDILQTKFSQETNKPDDAKQAFCFGLTARSTVSFLLLPITVIKVRYESGQYRYDSLRKAIWDAYLKSGWVGAAPTILRDSLFSGVYYMFYTQLKSTYCRENSSRPSSFNFFLGLISGLFASVITNPLDVLKTNIQVDSTTKRSMVKSALRLITQERGFLRFFDGLAPRSIRRTLIAATTWSFYEFFRDSLSSSRS